MLGHIIGQVKPKTASARTNVHSSLRPHDPVDRTMSLDHGREGILASINELHALSRRGLWGILMFLTLSAVTLYCREAGLFAQVPGEIRELFGEAPPLPLLHIALAVSWLSALVLILGRVNSDGRPCYSWYNIGLPTAFYPLYVFSDPAGTHFPAVFAAGLILLIVEHVSVLCYASKAIREGTDRLNQLPH
jgi:hypothetical protein